MKIKLICHSCVLLTGTGFGILCDPWFSGEVFNNGWHLEPEPENPPLSDSELESVTHIFISHEHPDHLHFPTLASLPKIVKTQALVLFQKNNSEKVLAEFKKMGYTHRVSLPHMQEYELAPGSSAKIYQHRQIDSALIVETADDVVVNLNDAELTGHDCHALAKRLGPVSVLLTQFSGAGSEGYAESDEREATRTRNKVLEQATALNPRLVVPFASFVRFCKPDNAHLNRYRNSCIDVKRSLKTQGITAHLVYPGGTLELRDNPPEDDEGRWQAFYSEPEVPPDLLEESVDISSLQAVIQQRITKWKIHYPSFLLKRIGEISFHLKDLSSVVTVNFHLNTVRIDEADSSADIEINSQPLLFAFKFDFGIQTLGVSGRYKVLQPEELMPRWKIVRIIGGLCNAEVYLRWSGLTNKTMRRWVWQRKGNLIPNILQQLKRFHHSNVRTSSQSITT